MAAYFTPAVFGFLTELGANNGRAWFQTNRDRYVDDVQEPALAFIADFAPRLKGISPHFRADAKVRGGSLYRIYRDTRFSADVPGGQDPRFPLPSRPTLRPVADVRAPREPRHRSGLVRSPPCHRCGRLRRRRGRIDEEIDHGGRIEDDSHPRRMTDAAGGRPR